MSLKETFQRAAANAKPRKKRLPPFSIRLSPEERARLAVEAAGAPLGAYIKAKVLGSPLPVRVRRTGLAVEDRTALAQALALLGRSRIANNLNQLSHLANVGALPMTAETEAELRDTLADVQHIRRLLLTALGLKPEDRPMILKGSQRGSGQNLAAHLLKMEDNEHVSLHELRGFASQDLHGAFKEIEAVSLGTRCRNYLFSLSLSPPEDAKVSTSVFEETIDRIENRLGLDGQPRAIVFHEKEGRRHAHCVWSRIDADTMTARTLPFFKQKLMSVARDLYLDHGWTMPRGLENAAERNPTNFSLAEWQQAKRQGVDPRWLKQAMQDCWKRSDNLDAFQQALQDRGFFLAKGDKRGFVVLDHEGEVWSLPRMLDVKTKEVRARLGDGDNLSSVEDTRKTIGERMTPALRRHIEESRQQFRSRADKLGQYKEEMTRLHRSARQKLEERQKAEAEQQTRARAERLPKGLRGLWHRLTGKYQNIRTLNEMEAQAARLHQAEERQKLIEKQLEQRAVLQTQFRDLRKAQAEQLLSLRADIGRFLKFSRGQEAQSRSRAIAPSLGLKLER